jgi:hypothetical protein
MAGSRIWTVLAAPAWLSLVAALAWAVLALWLDGPADRRLAGLLAGSLLACSAALLLWLRPIARAALAVAGIVVLVAGWWLSIPPRQHRDWLPDVARVSTASLDGNVLTFRNVRNFDYRSEVDFAERWETRAYSFDQLRGADIFIAYWGPTLIAHTIASWEFEGGRHLAVSIETRKEKGESYSALRGFFRQFELYYVVADERDVIGVRTVHRGERVFLYRLTAQPQQARRLLLAYAREINRLAERPGWYNALTHNCTTTARYHAEQAAAAGAWSWQILANGHLDDLWYRRGSIDTSLPFPELRRRSEITERARAAYGADGFSRRIREGLPGARATVPGA